MHVGFLALALLLSQALPVPLPCVPSDGTAVCACKRGSVTACTLLAEGEIETWKNLMSLAEKAEADAKKKAKAKEESTEVVDTGCGTGQDPNDDDQTQCTGQSHHIISMTVWMALERHAILKGQYAYRDPRFVARAKDLKAHCGWQNWHRQVDEEIAKWVDTTAEATKQQFEAYLREVFSRPDLLTRFPNGF